MLVSSWSHVSNVSCYPNYINCHIPQNHQSISILYITESAKAVYKNYTDKDAESSVGAWLRQSGNTYTRNITRASQ